MEAARARARENPRDADAQLALGHVLRRAGRFAEAATQMTKAARLRRGWEQGLYDVARVYFDQGDYRRARTACGALARVSKQGVAHHACMARTYLVWNRTDRALEEADAALAVDAQSALAHVARADAFRLRADVAQAEPAYRRAAELAPQDVEPHLGLGRLYAAANRRDDAVRAFRRALELDGDNPEVAYELGRLLGNDAEALALLQRAVTGRPTWPQAQVSLGEALLRGGQNEAALAAFQQAVRLSDSLARAHLGIGNAQLALNRPQEAEAALQRSLALVQDLPETHMALGDVYARTERPEEALEAYRRSFDRDPSNPESLLRAARLCISLRRTTMAAAVLTRLLDAHATHAPALALASEVAESRGETASAIQLAERALRGTGTIDRRAVEARLRALRARAGATRSGSTQPPRR